MGYIWDPVKAEKNFRDHHVYFEDGEYIFDDPFRIKRRDDDSSEDEERYQTIGMAGKVLFVIYTEEGEDDTRIISVRLADPTERRIIMTLVRHTHVAGSELSPEQIARLDEAAKYPITYDEDCPELTDEQLAEFKPVNFATMKERAEYMRTHGLIPPEYMPKAAGK
ncbi:MAG: BrnT family toxin [Treponema sp.]|jgi:uncharacterized DUF497 family protein|nr:BrnT family toxin [Treponema sp.]